jgi:NADH-dependent peroxiredoxin subunit F
MGVRFAAIPMGHEFTSLVLALLQAGGHPPKVEADVIEQIKALDGDFVFETYMSLTCHNCPDVVQALNLMAVLNPRIRHVAIDGGLFQAEVEQRQIMAVPSVFLNGQPFGSGRMELAEILAKVDTGAARATPPSSAPRRLRRADRRRRPGRRRGGRVRRAQGHPHRHRGRALRRPDAGHAGHRELHLGAGDRRARSSPPRWSARAAYDVDIMNGQRVASARAGAQPGGLASVTLDNGAC